MDGPSLQEEALFETAQRLADPAQRRALLEAACAGHPSMRQRIEELLALDKGAVEFFQAGAASFDESSSCTASASEEIGERLGRYRLREKIGEGGCGVVYVAEQEEPLRRRVALKIIKLGMDTESVVARFEAERQALAMMEHPNIAKVLDAGATENGRPFFVMELVRGIRITEFCDQHRLNLRERLELFVKVCQAVQHAHQKGIIHRDLKPSNILVTQHDAASVPKIIDFGIAKAMGGRLTNRTIYTELHQFIGTPAYMSPEQAGMSSLDIDTRSDIYSLGVLLYELLTGRTPFDAKDLVAIGVDEMRRTIREKEPVRPSTRLRTLQQAELTDLAHRRQAGPPKLIHLLRGDLDWIVMKCLEKDRSRRYDTSNDLAKDVQRHLVGGAVVARPSSTLYRFRKLIRRNKLVFAAGAAVVAALIIGFGFSTVMFLSERRAWQREHQLRQEAEVRELNLLAFQLLAEGKLAEAEAARRRVLDMQRKLGRREHPDVAASLESLSRILLKEGKFAEAETTFREALGIRRKLFGEENPIIAQSISDGADILESQNKLVEAEAMHRQALEIRRKSLGNENWEVAESLHKLALVLYKQHRFLEAEPMLREALAIRRRRLRHDDPKLAATFHHLAIVLREQGKRSEAAVIYREALPSHLKGWPSDPEQELRLLADGLVRERKYEEAEKFFNDILPAAGESLPQAVGILRARGNFRARRGHFREAAADYARTIELDSERSHDWLCLAVLLVESSQIDAYREHCRKSVERFRNTTEPSAAEQIAKGCLILRDSGIELSVAVQLINFAVSATNHEHIAWFELAKGLAEYRQDHFTGAIEWMHKLLDRGGGILERDAFAEIVLAMAQQRLKRTDEARVALRNARKIIDAELPKSDRSDLGRSWSDWLAVRALMREAQALIEDCPGG